MRVDSCQEYLLGVLIQYLINPRRGLAGVLFLFLRDYRENVVSSRYRDEHSLSLKRNGENSSTRSVNKIGGRNWPTSRSGQCATIKVIKKHSFWNHRWNVACDRNWIHDDLSGEHLQRGYLCSLERWRSSFFLFPFDSIDRPYRGEWKRNELFF